MVCAYDFVPLFLFLKYFLGDPADCAPSLPWKVTGSRGQQRRKCAK